MGRDGGKRLARGYLQEAGCVAGRAVCAGQGVRKMENLTAEQLIGAFGVLLVVFGAIVTIDKVIDIFKKWRKHVEFFKAK